MSNTTRMLLVRHGESTWNAVRRWQGQADPPLTERGENQARRAATAAVPHGPFDLVVGSSLQRAARTAELVAGGLGVDLATPIIDLIERSAGEWEGLTRGQIEEGYPGDLDNDRRPPGYEGDPSVVERVSRGLRSLHDAHGGKTLLVVSHGGVIHALERALGEAAKWQRLDNLTGRWFELTESAITPVGDRVALVADGGPPAAPPDRGYA